MKQMPISFRQFSEISDDDDTLTPSAVKTSALPQRLLAARLPCFATGKPAPAITKAAAGETINDFAELHTVSAAHTKHTLPETVLIGRAAILPAHHAAFSNVPPLPLHGLRLSA